MGNVITKALKGAFVPAEQPQLETNVSQVVSDDAGEVSPAFDKALRAATAAFRETFIAGLGKDETFHNEFFKPNSDSKRRFYALMADYATGEMLRLSSRFAKPR